MTDRSESHGQGKAFTDAVMADHKTPLFDGVLAKPYNMEDLATALAESHSS
jgi:hypothetical protein